MSLEQRLLDDLKQAMKEKNELETGVLRMLKNELMKEKTRKGGQKKLNDDTVVKLVSTYAKQLEEAKDQFARGGRDDLAEHHAQELEVVRRYLPEQADEDEIREVIAQAIEDTGAEDISEMGKVMGVVMKELENRADGKLVSKMVREKLQRD